MAGGGWWKLPCFNAHGVRTFVDKRTAADWNRRRWTVVVSFRVVSLSSRPQSRPVCLVRQASRLTIFDLIVWPPEFKIYRRRERTHWASDSAALRRCIHLSCGEDAMTAVQVITNPPPKLVDSRRFSSKAPSETFHNAGPKSRSCWSAPICKAELGEGKEEEGPTRGGHRRQCYCFLANTF